MSGMDRISGGLRGRTPSVTLPLIPVGLGAGTSVAWEAKRKQLTAINGARDFSYYTTINVGGQPFNIALDTGSADLWIQTQNCYATESPCSGAAPYIPSSTLLKLPLPFSLRYLSGEVSGQVARDTVRLAQYEIFFQVFALADVLANVTLAQIGISGMLGLAFPEIAAIPSPYGLPVIFNIASNLQVNQRFFSFRLGRDGGLASENSTFNIGQHDTIVVDPAALHYIPVYPANLASSAYDYWKVPLDSIIVNQIPINLCKSKIASSRTLIAVFDTGTSLILGPTADVDTIYSTLTVGNPSKNAAGQWTIDCILAIDLLFIIGGRPYPIHPLDLAWDKMSDGQGRCFGGIQANDGVLSGDFLFGDTAMRNIYAAHYFATAYSPPLLALLSTTSPSASLREFINARGPGFILNPGATFSDDVLQTTYSSLYPTGLNLQHGLLNATTFSDAPPDYYNLKAPRGGSTENVAARNTLFVLLVLAFSGGVGFVAGVIMMFLRKRHGWIFYPRLRRRTSSLQEDKTLLVGSAGMTNMHTRRDRRQSGKRYTTTLRGAFSKPL